jgi:hypothetical protein
MRGNQRRRRRAHVHCVRSFLAQERWLTAVDGEDALAEQIPCGELHIMARCPHCDRVRLTGDADFERFFNGEFIGGFDAFASI